MTQTQQHMLAGLALAAMVAVCYYQVHDQHFVWDTIPFVLENPWLYPLTFDSFISILTEAHRANWQPLVLLSHSL